MNNSMHEQAAAARSASSVAHVHRCACNGKCGDKCACKQGGAGNGCGGSHHQAADEQQNEGEQKGDGRS